MLAYEPYVELAERLIAKTPGDFAKKAYFLTTGAEAVENAIRSPRPRSARPSSPSAAASTAARCWAWR